jgi:hypothetical protein
MGMPRENSQGHRRRPAVKVESPLFEQRDRANFNQRPVVRIVSRWVYSLGALRAVAPPSCHKAGCPECAQAGRHGRGDRGDRGVGEHAPNPSTRVEESGPHRGRQEHIVNLALDPL